MVPGGRGASPFLERMNEVQQREREKRIYQIRIQRLETALEAIQDIASETDQGLIERLAASALRS